MNPKYIAIIVGFLASLTSIGFGQFQTITNRGIGPVSVNIGTGQVLQVLSFTHDGTYAGTLSLYKPNFTQTIFASVLATSTAVSAQGPILAGPATLYLNGNSSSSTLCLTYKVFDNATVTGTSVPSTSVVIPADATGSVDIILESSTDLVTWTAALPGNYGSSTAKRFFRVRAAVQ